ncbi:zinc knuckle CX2CX4HX4C containing protein [Tanacetum coccineum]
MFKICVPILLIFTDMVPLPPREQRHPFLRGTHRVQVLDFEGMPVLMRDVLYARIRMEHRDGDGVVVFTSHAWEEEMESPDFARRFATGRKSRALISVEVMTAKLVLLVTTASVTIVYFTILLVMLVAARLVMLVQKVTTVGVEGTDDKDAHEHVRMILEIADLFHFFGVTHDAVMIRVFPITLKGPALRWINGLPAGLVTTWDLLEKVFIMQYCPPFKTSKKLEIIHNFRQEMDETLYHAWERYNDLLFKCASVNVIPKSIFEHLKLARLKKTDMLIEMADMTKRSPIGIVESIYVKIDKFLFPSDFVVMDMLNTRNETMIFGRPFLATIHAKIDVFNKEISLGIRGDRVTFDMDKNDFIQKVQGDNTYWWHDHKSEEEERKQLRIDIEEYNPPMVYVKTFEVKRYSFDTGQNFICVIKELMDALSLGIENGSRF